MHPIRRAAVASTIAVFASVLSPAAAAEPPKEGDQHFQIDPVADIVISGAGAGLSGLLGLILSTGEIRPQQITDKSVLLPIDRIAVDQTIDPNAGTYSDVVLWSAVGFAVLDPVMSGLRDGWDAALVDGVMYAESLSLSLTLTDLTKIGVRRPRPIDYVHPDLTTTDKSLSFFSGHAATLAAVTATASYLAFVRAPRSPRPWITLAVGTLLTAFVSYERVRSGEHFPTDVLAGALGGAAVGVLVPHFHLHREEHPAVWIGLSPVPSGGGAVDVHGVF
jgi:undecaprenyl-diphosphatase